MLLHIFPDTDGGERLYSAKGLSQLAREQAGLASGPDEIVGGALEQLCNALETARAGQSLFGKIHAQQVILDALTKQLRLADYLQRFPEIRSVPVPDPVFIVAPFRTGTTFLHRLLAQDPGNRTPRLWEAAYAPPVRPDLRRDTRYLTEDPRIARAETALRGLSRGIPRLGALHPMGAHLAEECLGLLETSFLSHSFMFYAEVPAYLSWLNSRSGAEWRAAYEAYLLQLRLLQWMAPGQRWVLKSPIHLWNLDILLACFPSAHVVHLHRDPAAVMASFCNLLAAWRAGVTKAADPQAIGRQAASYMQQALARGVAARRRLDATRCIDIRTETLTATPMDAARTIYARMDAELTAATVAQMQLWLSRPQQTRVPGGLGLAAFGLDAEAVRQDFAEYSAFSGG